MTHDEADNLRAAPGREPAWDRIIAEIHRRADKEGDGDFTVTISREDYDAACAAAPAAPPEEPTAGREPAGYKLVPVEPTPAMWDAAENASMECSMAIERGEFSDDARQFPTQRVWNLVCAYRAMLAAAPAEEAQPVEPVALPPGTVDMSGRRLHVSHGMQQFGPNVEELASMSMYATKADYDAAVAQPASQVRAQALEEILSRAPHFPGVSGAEPPLVDLIRRYYRMHFADRKIADGYADQYIAALKDQP